MFERYLAEGQGPDFEAAGITTVDEFTAFYWQEQLGTAGTVFVLGVLGGLGGAAIYGIARPRPRPAATASGGGAGA